MTKKNSRVIVKYRTKVKRYDEEVFVENTAELGLDVFDLPGIQGVINTMIAAGNIIISVTHEVDKDPDVEVRRIKSKELERLAEELKKPKPRNDQQANWPQFYCGPPWANGIGYTLHFAQHVPVYNPNEIMLDSNLKTW